jgi:hypothetical protein
MRAEDRPLVDISRKGTGGELSVMSVWEEM